MQTKQKEILLDQIMGLLNTQNSAHDSLRFSQDYTLSMRGTFKDQMEEIDFKFLDEQDRLQQEKLLNLKQQEPATNPNQFAKIQSFGRNREVIIDPKKEEVLPQTKRLKTKKSIQLSEQIHKKVSTRGSSDQFTKKYDNLFDEIFFNQKQREEASQSKSKQQMKEQKREVQDVVKIQEKPVTVQNRLEAKNQHNNFEVQPKILPTSSTIPQSNTMNYINVQSSPNKGKNEHSSPLKGKSLEQSVSQLSLQIVDPNHSETETPFLTMQSTKSISNFSQQSNVCDLLNKQILEAMLKNYIHNPTLVQSLKPQVRINYNDKKPLVTFRPLNVQSQSPHIIRINPLNPTIRLNPSTIQINPNNQASRVVQHANSNPVITFSPNHPTIKIQTNSGLSEIRNSPIHPQINFNYKGPTQAIVKQAQKVEFVPILNVNKQNQKPQAIELIQKEQERLPVFLRRLRELTSIYPNFYSKQTLTPQNCNKLKNDLVESFSEVKKAIKKLKGAHLKYHEMTQTIKRLYKQMTTNVSSSKKNDLKTIQFFKSTNWRVEETFPQLDELKPHEVFQKRELNELQFMTLLNSFEDIIENLQKEPSLNLQDPQTFKIYMNARQKLWNFQKNLRLMSEDFYLKVILKINLPLHILQSHEILIKKRNLNEQQRKRQIQRLMFLQQHKDIFSTCCLGQQTLKLLLEK